MVELKGYQIKKFLPAVVLVTSVYYSTLFTLAILAGYFVAKIFYHKLVEKGRINSIFIDMGKWTFHLHHWIMGAVVLGVAWVIRDFHLSAIFTGFICGVIAHDIYDFNDWYKVIMRNRDDENGLTA